jgi:hypothetical protein
MLCYGARDAIEALLQVRAFDGSKAGQTTDLIQLQTVAGASPETTHNEHGDRDGSSNPELPQADLPSAYPISLRFELHRDSTTLRDGALHFLVHAL